MVPTGRVGFEPTVDAKPTTVFETAPIDHSGTSPGLVGKTDYSILLESEGDYSITAIKEQKFASAYRFSKGATLADSFLIPWSGKATCTSSSSPSTSTPMTVPSPNFR